MTEDQVISYLKQQTDPKSRSSLGLNDDGAVVRIKSGKYVVASDAIAENTHFKRINSTSADWASKLLLCNVSDFAAMGAKPEYATLTMGIPKKEPWRSVKSFIDRLLVLCDSEKIKIIGGDTVKSDALFFSMTLFGSVFSSKKILKRKGCKPKDFVFVTGALGGSQRSRREFSFKSRLPESKFLSAEYPVRGMIDLSDGLSKDLRRLSELNQVGFLIYDAALPDCEDSVAIEGAYLDGEDFELLFSLSPREALRLMKDERASKKGLDFYPIGRVTSKLKGLKRVNLSGELRNIPKAKEFHFD